MLELLYLVKQKARIFSQFHSGLLYQHYCLGVAPLNITYVYLCRQVLPWLSISRVSTRFMYEGLQISTIIDKGVSVAF